MNEPRGLPADIENCDREPIHIPGAIQPHGVLLSLREPDLVIVQASDNTHALFGRDAAQVLGQPLAALLAAESLDRVRRAVWHEPLAEVNPLALALSGRPCDGVLHRHEGALILEIEPRLAAADAPERSHHPLRHAVAELQSAATPGALYEAAVKAVQRLTQFERVMIYRFDEDGHGAVEAEAMSGPLYPYLGLHYPASDIPRQARELYLRNPIRIIPDARYTPAALVPALRPDTGAPLDLSFSVLRSVSPVHLEYLANMGVRGSMSISLVVRGRLWGLVSCIEHRGPRPVPYEVRSDCELLGRIVSLQISAFEDRETASGRERRRPVLERLAEAMRDGDEALAGLLAQPGALFGLLRIEGAAIVNDELLAAGRAPAPAAIRALADWLDQAGEPGVFLTDALAKNVPAFAGIKDRASGIVSFTLPGAPPRRFLGFRPEMLQTVDWGGDPRKPVQQDGSMRLHPRRSFALWREEVRLRSRPWTAADREAAEELRRAAVEADLAKQVQRAQRAARARDDLVAVVSHDLKNPLGVIQMQGELLRKLAGAQGGVPASHLTAGIDRIQRSLDHMLSLIGDLLDLAKIEAGRFALQKRAEPVDEIVEESLALLRPLAESKGLALREEIAPGLVVLADRERVFQVLSNLIGNAIKFTPSGGRIALRAAAQGSHALFAVTDTGPGVAPEDMPRIFDRYWQAPKKGSAGSGLGLYIAKGIVEAHGGHIWAERAEEGGAAFRFTLPLA
jgi:light-regulated signal transduction histidine kinase (bacteriophytochrome)